jgi:hypothetical protein
VLPTAFSFSTNAVFAPPNVARIAAASGKLADAVDPVTKASPLESTAIAAPRSSPAPPIYVA